MRKMQKRPDNHLARCHKGVTRAMNDNQSILPPSHLRVTCLLPGCGKEILHISHHLKNMHCDMCLTEYHTEEIKERRSKQLQEEGKEMKNKEVMKHKKLEKVQNESSLVKGHEGVLGLDSDITDGENNYCYCEQDDSDQVKEKTVQYSEPSDVEINHKQEEGVCKQVEETTVQELHVNGFSGEKLRFLVHNTTPDGVRFFYHR